MSTELIEFSQSAAEAPGEGGSGSGPAVSDLEVTGLIPADIIGQFFASLAPPQQLLLGAVRDGRLRVVHPFNVLVRREEGQANWILEADEINEFGFGKNISEAIADLQAAIAELYFSLSTDVERLGPDLQNVWKRLQVKITRRETTAPTA